MISNLAMSPKSKSRKKTARRTSKTAPGKKKRTTSKKRGALKKSTPSSAKALVTRRPLHKKEATSVVPTTSDPLLQAYMREVNKHPLLTREEEKELALRFFERGDRDAFQKLVTSNLRFVVKIAYQYIHYRLKLLDLIQEGNMGLVKAVEQFDPYKEVRLTTYAVWWIRSYIQDAILKNFSLVKIGTTQNQKKLFYRLRKEQARLEKEGIAPPDRVKLLASRLDVKEKEVIEMDQRLNKGEFSLDAPVQEGENQSHMDFLTDDRESVPDALADSEQKLLFRNILEEFGKSLEGREATFFQERLTSEKPKTLQELGEKFGVSKERARQIEEKIKKKLKAYVVEKYPDYDLLGTD